MPGLTVSVQVPPPVESGRSPVRRWRSVWVMLATVILALVGCAGSSDDAEPPSAPVVDEGRTGGSGELGPQEGVERAGIDGDFGEVVVTITSAEGEICELCLLLADRHELRSQGLMGVTDSELGGYDGMLFDHGAASSGGYWMKDTLLALSIAYWADDGTFVSSVDMDPCTEDQPGACPTYPADGPFRYALEVPQGGLEEILAVEGSTLLVEGIDCSTLDA